MSPGGSSNPLAPEMRADRATRMVFEEQFGLMLQNEPALRAATDPEPLHDYRVALRRTRTALGCFKRLFEPTAVAHFRAEFSWLGDVTGPARDLDVLLLERPVFQDALPLPMRPHLEPLWPYLAERRGAEQERLVERLDSKRYATLLDAWRRFLEQPPPDSAPSAGAHGPILQVGSERIWKLYGQVNKRGHALDSTSRSGQFHRLRITCKKLRYLMEFFRELYDPTGIELLIRTMKRFQNRMGSMNDLSVQHKTLQRLADRLNRKRLVPLASVVAMLQLARELRSRRNAERESFKEGFQRFSTPEIHSLADSLFGPAIRSE